MKNPPKPRRCKVCENIFYLFLLNSCGSAAQVKCTIKHSHTTIKANKIKADWKIEDSKTN
jgi:hypothetical protein